MPPKVWHIKDKNCPKDAVYIGRPSRWGNPFKIGVDGNRIEVIEKYKKWLDGKGNINLLDTGTEIKILAAHLLKGKDLSCWCAPQACHGDVLLEIANG